MTRPIKLACAWVVLLGLGVAVHAEETVKGKIKNADTTRNEVVLKGIIKDTVYELNKGTRVWLDGHPSKLADLKTDDQAVVTYEKKGEHMIASDVRAVRNAKETTGTVRSVSPDKREIIIKGLIKDSTYELNKDGTVWADAKKGTLTDVREGDQVLITYEERGERLHAADVTVTKRK